MSQKLCATCQKELTASERALGEIQCAACYRNWCATSVAKAEPEARKILDEMRSDSRKKSDATSD